MSSYIIEKDKLKGEYSKAFDRVEGYAMVRSVDSDTMEEMLMNLVDILYAAQNDGKPVEKIIGRDIDKFCDEYFSAYKPIRTWLKDIPGFIYNISVWCLVFCVLDVLFPEEDVPLWSARLDLFPVICGIVSGLLFVLIFTFIGRFIWKKYKNISSNLLSGIYTIGFVATITVCVCYNSKFEILLPLIPLAITSGTIAVIYKSVEFYIRYQKYGSIKKPKKDGSLKEIFKESFNETSVEYPIELKKQYIKKNKKLEKRGKEQMSPEKYMDFLRKNNKKLEKQMYLIFAFYIIVFQIVVYKVSLDSTRTDTIIFAVILAVCLSAVYIAFFKLNNMMVNKNKELLDKCDADGITVIELASRIEEKDAEKSREDGVGETTEE